MSDTRTILFAGGGTGGHIFPNLAIWERLTGVEDPQAAAILRPHFLLSNRGLDRDILAKTDIPFTQLTVKPWSGKPWHWPAFLAALYASKRKVESIIDRENVKAIVITGGFVSGPAAMAAQAKRIPLALVNLDAVPGKANRRMADKATPPGRVFSAYDSPLLPGAMRIGLPLRLCALAPSRQSAGKGLTDMRPLAEQARTLPGEAYAETDSSAARVQLGLDPNRHTLMITGGSQGAQSVNQAVLELLRHHEVLAAMRHWQVLHITGPTKDNDLSAAYAELKLPAKVVPFCDTMGLAWGAATLAISRSGAGSVAEAWANATPAIFLPYPFHKDDHQRLNAGPMVAAGGAVLLKDLIDPKLNASQLAAPLLELVSDEKRRDAMVGALAATRPVDGAEAVAAWVMARVMGQ
jgi:UDP-N-acetylglucosamine--N-acetylmuramyl-(pentapeptide) pyrophosphoryl-undecaprenol N-acetylglucosamine transferase